MKKLILLVCLIVIGCKTSAPNPTPSPPQPTVIGPAVAVASPSTNRFDDYRKLKPKGIGPSKPFIGGPAPSWIQDCITKNYKTWDELNACLNAPHIAPGKLGATGSTPPAVCLAQQVPSWFVSNAGNDNNTCVTSGSPCLTVQAIEQRWGCGGGPVTAPTITNAVVINFLNAQASTAASNFVVNPTIVDAGSFALTCTTTTLATGTLGTVTAKNRAIGQSLNIDLGGGSGGFSNNIIIDTTRGTQAWVDGAALSGNVFRITQPMNNATDAEDDGWTAGDAFSIQTTPNIFLQSMEPRCGILTLPNEAVPSYCGERVTLNNCNIPNVARAGSQFWSTSLFNVNVHTSYLGGVGDFKSTAFHNSVLGFSEHNLQNCNNIGGAMLGPFVTGTGDPYGAYLGNDIIIHGSMVFPPGSIVTLDAVAVDNTSEAFIQGLVFGGASAAVFLSGVPNFWYLTQPGGTYTLAARYSGTLYGAPSLDTQLSTGISLSLDLPTSPNDAVAIDFTQNPVKTYTRPLTVSNFCQPISQGGFNCAAYDSQLLGGFANFGGQTFTRVPYQAQPFTALGAPPMIAYNPALWLRGDYVLVNGSNRVQYLSDQFAQGRDYNSPISALVGPIWGGAASPTMTFNGGDTFIGHTPGAILPGVGNNTTMFAVVKTTSNNPDLTIFCTDLLFMGDNFIGTTWGSFNGGPVDSTKNINDGNVHVLVMATTTASNVAFYTDGVKTTSTAGTSFNSRGGSCGLGGQVTIQQFIGDIDEIVLYTRLLSDDAVNLVGRYLSGRWGGSWGLPLTQTTDSNGWNSSTIPALTTGTTTITQAQSTTPLLIFSGTLTGANTIVLPNTPGYYKADLAAVTFGVNSITFQSGAGTCSTIVAANITGLHQLVDIVTEGTNTIRCSL